MKIQKKEQLMNGFDSFIRYCKAKNLSQHTIKYYETTYNSFCEFCPYTYKSSSITRETAYGFIDFLKERNSKITAITINTYLRGIRAFFYYLMEMGDIPKFKVSLVKVDKPIKETYTDTELKILLAKPNIKRCTFHEYRNWAIINYLLATGNRASTVVNIKISDVDFEAGLIKLQKTKNRRQQLIPISNTLSGILNEYLNFRKGSPDDFLFCNEQGKQMSTDSLHNAISKYNLTRGVTKTSIHLFRHTFAKKWILNGGDIFRLQKLLGHSSLDIVKEYVNMFSADLMIDFNNFNPLESMGVSSKNKIIRM